MNNLLQLSLAALLVLSLSAVAQNNSEELRDPTRPLSYAAPQRGGGPDLVLQAVLKREGGREAIVSGQRVRVGSAINGARVEEINRQSLVYSYGGQRHTLSLRPQVRQ